MAEATTIKLDLPLILPDVFDVQDRCVTRLLDALAGRPGIVQAHLVGLEQGAAQLCIHYKPDTLTLGRVRELVQSVGADLTARFAHLVIRADSTLHARAARSAADSLRSVSGALEADASASGTLRIEYDRAVVSETILRARADGLGTRSAPESGTPAAPDPGSVDHWTGAVAHDKNASHVPAAHAAPHEAADP